MNEGYPHKVLITGCDPEVVKTVTLLSRRSRLGLITADNGSAALKTMADAETPFSLIIADQRLNDMLGTRLLEQVKKISPDTQRFLLTAYSEIGVIIDAVNKGAIQRYIQKPWDTKTLLKAVRSGLRQFELGMENERLQRLAKDQNAKLFDLSCELMETTTGLNNEIQALEKQIEAAQQQICQAARDGRITLPMLVRRINEETDQGGTADAGNIEQLLSETILILHDRFKDVANRNGFEMPDVKGPGS